MAGRIKFIIKKENQMKLKKMIKVMQHFADGGGVECTETGFDEWEIAYRPCWNWSDYNY